MMLRPIDQMERILLEEILFSKLQETWMEEEALIGNIVHKDPKKFSHNLQV